MLNLSPGLMIAEEVWVILSCCVSHKPASMTCLPCQRGDKLRQRQGHIPGSGYIQILGSWLFQALNQNWLSPPGLSCLFPCAPVWIQGDALLLGWEFSTSPLLSMLRLPAEGSLFLQATVQSQHTDNVLTLSWGIHVEQMEVPALKRDRWQVPLCQPRYLDSIWAPAVCVSPSQELFSKLCWKPFLKSQLFIWEWRGILACK